MIRVAICDDEKLIATRIEELVIGACIKRGVRAFTDTFYSGSSLMEYIRLGNEYDIIYLDIEMPDMDGIEFAKRLRTENTEVMLVYISAHTEYAIQLFDVDTFRFIKKPIDVEEFEDVLNKAYERMISHNRFFTYFYNKSIYKIRIKSILYFESKGRIIHINTVGGKEKFYGKLDDAEEKLRTEKIQFLRIHKSFLVNMEYVEKISYDKVYLKNGEELRISEERKKMIQREYLNMEA